jgi:hypothetical protein
MEHSNDIKDRPGGPEYDQMAPEKHGPVSPLLHLFEPLPKTSYLLSYLAETWNLNYQHIRFDIETNSQEMVTIER